MARRFLWGLVLTLSFVGCAAEVAMPSLETLPPGEHQPDAAPDGMSLVDSSDAAEDATSEPDADVADAREPSDAGVDAEAGDSGAVDDAGDSGDPIDAATDAGSPDTGAPDTGPPPACIAGQNRCFEYQYQECNAGAWEWQMGDQSCCHDARFVVSGATVTDTQTGLKWKKGAGRANSRTSAEMGCAPARLPTSAELLAITIGPPVANKSVCSPTVDQLAFAGMPAADAWTSDGCVDLIRAVSKTACANADGVACVLP